LIKIGASEKLRELFVPFAQNYTQFSPALDATERLLLSGKIKHGGAPLLRASFANVKIAMDGGGGRRIVKRRDTQRVDPAVAAVMAIGSIAPFEADAKPAPAYQMFFAG
jgi:phage terminase large subunit-like protein